MDQEFDVIKSPEGRHSGAGGTRSVDDLNLITRRYESLHWMGHTTPRAGGEGVCQDTSKEGSETCAVCPNKKPPFEYDAKIPHPSSTPYISVLYI
jgi:hypothetical protein